MKPDADNERPSAQPNNRTRVSGLRQWLASWGSFFLPFIALYGVVAIVGRGMTWWLAGRDVAGDAARVGVPPLFAALLAWGLSESTRRQEQRGQVHLREDEQTHREWDATRSFHRDNLLQLQAQLQELNATANLVASLPEFDNNLVVCQV